MFSTLSVRYAVIKMTASVSISIITIIIIIIKETGVKTTSVYQSPIPTFPLLLPPPPPFFLDPILPLLPCTPTCFFYLHSTFLLLTGRSREILRLTSCLDVCCTSVAASLCQDEQSAAVFSTWVNTTARDCSGHLEVPRRSDGHQQDY